MFAPHRSHAHAYSAVHIETGVHGADPHQLITLLLDGALSAIATAFNAIERGDMPAKGRAISRAVGIVDEGRAPRWTSRAAAPWRRPCTTSTAACSCA